VETLIIDDDVAVKNSNYTVAAAAWPEISSS